MYYRAVDHEGITYSIQVLSSHTKLDRKVAVGLSF